MPPFITVFVKFPFCVFMDFVYFALCLVVRVVFNDFGWIGGRYFDLRWLI